MLGQICSYNQNSTIDENMRKVNKKLKDNGLLLNFNVFAIPLFG